MFPIASAPAAVVIFRRVRVVFCVKNCFDLVTAFANPIALGSLVGCVSTSAFMGRWVHVHGLFPPTRLALAPLPLDVCETKKATTAAASEAFLTCGYRLDNRNGRIERALIPTTEPLFFFVLRPFFINEPREFFAVGRRVAFVRFDFID